MKVFNRVLFGFALVLMMLGSGWATVLTIPVNSSTDDHEEFYNYSHTADAIDSQDLDLMQRRIGMRFQNVTIPKGTTITSAYLEFMAGSPVEIPQLTDNLRLNIRGQASSNPDTFSQSDSNVYNRWNNYDTNASVDWDVSTPWTNLEIVKSPELKSVIQEIVDRNDWASGRNLVLMVGRREDWSNRRTVYSFDGSPGGSGKKAPVLVIEYAGTSSGTSGICEADVRVNASTDDAQEDGDGTLSLYHSTLPWGDQWLGFRFTSVPVPKNAQITSAYLDLATGSAYNYEHYNKKENAKALIYGEDSNDAVTFGTSSPISSRPVTNAKVTWKESNDWKNYLEVNRSPDISTIVQEIVSRSGWVQNNDMAFLLENLRGRRPVLAYDDSTISSGTQTNGEKLAALLHVSYECSGGSGTTGTTSQPKILLSVANSTTAYLGTSTYQGDTPATNTLTVKNIGDANLNYTISGLPSWLTLTAADGTVITSTSSTTATRLLAPGASESFTVSYLTSTLAVGTYQEYLTFNDSSAVNPNQKVQVSLTVNAQPDTNSTCSNVPLYVQNRVSPAVLINLDLSGSMTNSTMPVVGDITLSQTPELKTVVQEIVDRSGWVSGNDMVFIVSGSGNRRAKSYDRDSASAPLLVVNYTDGNNVAGSVSVRVSAGKDDVEENGSSGYTDSSNVLDLGNMDVGLRFRNVSIPKPVTIDSAYIQFTPDAADSSTTDLTIVGEATDNAGQFSSTRDIASRTTTTASVSWSGVSDWVAPTQKSRLAIAQDVIKKIVENQSINWGYGTWEGRNNSADNYTKIEVGCKVNTAAHMTAIKDAVDAAYKGGSTPFVPSMDAARDYFAGNRPDLFYNENFAGLSCQDKFDIEITDGLGNLPSGTTAADAETATQNLANDGVSTVAVGFGIDDASMINAVAAKANTLGKASDTDRLYALHDEVSGTGVPFLATNQQELLDSLMSISKKIENRFTGSAPAPTTSANDDDLLMVLIAEFGSASWTGNLRAMGFSLVTNDWTTELWNAADQMPATRNVWTVVGGAKTPYLDTTLAHDNYLCKDIGDIIDSAPVIVKWPSSYYSIDGYRDFYTSHRNRNNMVYVGSNDGQLHAFLLTDITDPNTNTVTTQAGTEMWSFVPPSQLPKLDLAQTDPSHDMCDAGYCHEYFVDGSPQAADIYVNSDWHTILITGLREGGDSYFALDVTDGQPMSSSNSSGAQYLWEFTDTDLGQTWGDARINRVADSTVTDGHVWGAFFGSGYAADGATSAAQTSKQAYIYGIDAYDASALWKDSGGNWTNKVKLTGNISLTNDAMSELLLVDKDYDPNFAADFIYGGNLYGDLYRVQQIGKGEVPAVSTFFDSTNSTTSSPIRARPSYAYSDIPGNFWLYFGTGRYEQLADKTSTDQQYFYGLKEIPDADGNYNRSYAKPSTLDTVTIDPNNTTTLDASGNPSGVQMVALKSTGYTMNSGATLVRVVEGQNPNNESWAIRLGTDSTYSERVISQPLVMGGIVFFTSFVPDDDACAGSGKSYLYAVDYRTGKAPQKPVFDINGDNQFNDADKMHATDANGNDVLVNVAAIGIGDGLASDPKNVGDKIFVNLTNPNDQTGTTDSTQVISVNISDLRAKLNSWYDGNFQ